MPERAEIDAHCAECGVSPVWIGEADAPLIGAHQRQNAALALTIARDLGPIDDTEASTALAAVRWHGRLEIIGKDPLTIIDVGHTPAAIAAARAGFDTMREGHDAVLVCGASADKKIDALISALALGFSTIICAAARHKGAPAAEIAAAAHAVNPQAELVLAESVTEARRLALAKAKASYAAIYVAGGLFLAAEFKWVHLGRDPALLAFF